MIKRTDLKIGAAEKNRALVRLARARKACDAAANGPWLVQERATRDLLDAEAFIRELGVKEDS